MVSTSLESSSFLFLSPLRSDPTHFNYPEAFIECVISPSSLLFCIFVLIPCQNTGGLALCKSPDSSHLTHDSSPSVSRCLLLLFYLLHLLPSPPASDIFLPPLFLFSHLLLLLLFHTIYAQLFSPSTSSLFFYLKQLLISSF